MSFGLPDAACGAVRSWRWRWWTKSNAPLENQIILAEDLWMILHSQGASSQATLANVSARIKRTRELLEEHDEANPA
jgi:hypothetical protein